MAGDVGAIACVQADHGLDRVRAFVKIQDGCSFSCRFCVIPLVRGATRSRSAAAVLAEVRRRVAQGHREVVLTGVNLGCFRDREAGYRLPRLVREAGAVPGLARLRLSSIEVNHVDDELIAALRETPTVSAHLHVPLQSGDDGVLAAMGRRYTVASYLPQARAAGGLQPDHRRDRRLPRRERPGLRAHASRRASGRAHEGTRLPVLAAARTRTEAADSIPAAVKKERGARLARPPRPPAERPGSGRSATRTACSSTGPAAATATTTRRGSSTRRSASSCGRVRSGFRRRGSRCLRLTASSAGSFGTATMSTRQKVSSRSGTSIRKAETHLLVLPERHVDSFREVGAFDPRRRSGCSSSSPRRRAGRPRGLPSRRQRRARRRPDGLPPPLARARRQASRRCLRDEPDRRGSRTSSRARARPRRAPATPSA